MPQDLPADLPANCSIMLGEAMSQETDVCHNIKDRYNRSGRYHIEPDNYVPEVDYANNETN